jgi:hypothetical protein
MKNELQFDATIWEEFQKQAKKRRRNPVTLITEMMREQLEIWEDEKLDKAMRRDARKSGYKEEDAVKIVRQYRLEKKQQADLLDELLANPIKLNNFEPLPKE